MENIEKHMLVRTIIRREPSSNDGTWFVKLFNNLAKYSMSSSLYLKFSAKLSNSGINISFAYSTKFPAYFLL